MWQKMSIFTGDMLLARAGWIHSAASSAVPGPPSATIRAHAPPMLTNVVAAVDRAARTWRFRWSLDARLMVRPAGTFRQLSTQPLQGGLLVALRRPLVIAVALGFMASLTATGTATLRLVVPATLYWAYAPLMQCCALGLVLLMLRHRRQRTGTTFDVYFAGRAPMLLLQLLIVGTLASI